MKTVDVIFPAYINATIGPCGTLRRLNQNKDYLKQRGYELTIFTLDNAIKKSMEIDSPVDFSKGLSFRSRIKRFLEKSSIGILIAGIYGRRRTNKLLSYYRQLDRKADVIVFHDVTTCGYYSPYKKDNQKFICFFHSDGTQWGMLKNANRRNGESIWNRYLNKVYKRAIKSIDKFTFIAKIGKINFLREHPQIRDTQTFFLHNGIENLPIITSDRSYDKKYSICSVGSLSHRKGQYLIVEAMGKMPKHLLKDIHLTLYGTGPDFSYIEALISKFNLQNNVTLYGNLPNKEIHKTLSSHDIFVLMSNNEGLPISILEAMRAGLPVISTKVSGIPEEVDDRNGILIDRDLEQLINILSSLDNYDWQRKSIEARKRFETEFDFHIMLSKYCDMLDSCLGK